MNEVTRIHLGRQPYTISTDAHKELKDYLAELAKTVGDQEVMNEVELRMSELLMEHGVTDEKVILPADVEFLKQQLGDPDDFRDKDDAPETPTSAADKGTKRLFRDTDNALVAGVAAGIATYFGLDAAIVRLLFIVLAIFSGGVGIILYILLWLVVPPAKTTSEKLQMKGRAVTLEALKDSVTQADVPSALQRLNNRVAPIINTLLRLIVKLLGIGFMLTGLGIVVGVAVLKVYMLLHGGRLFQEDLFPVGLREEWLLALVMGLLVIVAIFLLLTGIASFRRKWPIGGWLTGVLLGIFLIGAVASIALAADAVPRVRDRYETSLHTTAVRGIQPFDKVTTSGAIDIAYVSSPTYSVNVHYTDHPDLSKLKIHVDNGTLYIDSTALDNAKHCTMLCLFPRYDMTVQIYAPNIQKFVTPPRTDIFYPTPPELN